MPIRVTFIGSLPPHKGISPYCLSLASAIARTGATDLDVLTFASLYPARLYPGGSPSVDAEPPTEVPHVTTRRALRWWNPLGWILAGLTLRGDIVHAQWWSYPLAPVYVTLLAIARLRGKRVVVTVHNVEPHEGGLLRRIANRIVLPFAHHIIVHEEGNAQTLLAHGMDSNRVSVVPHGVPDASPILQPERDEARRELGLDDTQPVVLFLGNIRPYKGLPTLLAAFKRLLASQPDARLIVAGQPWTAASDIERQIRTMGLQDHVLLKLEYLTASDMRARFAAADVVAYPYTHFDAQSGAACDGVRHGKAIVVSDAGGLHHLVRDSLAIVPAEDHERLADALGRILTDETLRTKLEQDSIRVAEQFAWPVVAQRTVDVYRRLLREPVETALGARSAREDLP